ncbi:Dihydropyrimidinase-related protein 5 [Lonchura striata]|uniref:Dihydropyrimidinase-related protein 5 n=49 Tax=Passeriformes TaxID=9126 RepID=A0A218UBS1_9PASE|nr:Dihydropyrimidinase-related protein 5 [Lonchura striata domestica]
MMANAATMRILIKGGKVVNDDCTLEADVYIENGIIQQVGRELMIPGGAKVIDATGKLVIPGGIDTSTHFHQTFMNATCVDDFYHGTKAALVGGTTMIIGHVLPDKETSLLDAYEKCRGLADPKVCCDYALHMGITWWAPKVKAEMETLVREKGVNSFQMFMTYKDLYMLRDSELYQVLRACRDIGAIARVHAENGELVAEGAKEALDLGITGPEGIEISRPEELEAEATHRVITIANRTHCPVYLVNVSSMSAGDVIAAAKMQGKVVYAETTTAHATLTGLHYYHQDWFHAAAYVTVPPLRLDTNTSAYLMSLLAKGAPFPELWTPLAALSPRSVPRSDTLNIVASDHRPFSTKQKAMGKEDFTKIPHGVSGVQDRMNIIWERGVVGGKMDENRFVAVTSSNAAKLHNLYPRKGRIIPGADADVVVWDPEATKTVSASTQVQGGDINLYENMRCHGVPLVTISRGRVVYENGVFMCAEGTGKFCPLRSFPDIAYKKLVQREKSLKLRGVDRTPYLGDVAVVVHAGKKETGTPLADTPTRPATRHGGMRDLHESSFSLSVPQRTSPTGPKNTPNPARLGNVPSGILRKNSPATRNGGTEADAQILELNQQLMDLKLTVDGLEKERDFYFSKLRDIELICQEHENENSPIITGIVSVLYATEEGFAPPEDDELEEQPPEDQDEY